MCPARYKRGIDTTVLSPISGLHWYKKIFRQLEVSAFSNIGQYLSYFQKFITFVHILEIVKVSGKRRGYFGKRKERKK